MVFNRVRQFGSQARELKKLRDQAVAMQRQLAQEKVILEEQGVRVVISGDMKIQELDWGQADSQTLTTVLNKAIKRAQEAAARQLQEMGGGLTGLSKLMGQ